MTTLTLPILSMPRPVPLQKYRTPQENIPQTRAEREELRSALRAFVRERKPVPPLSVEELRRLSEEFAIEQKLPEKYTNYVAVLLNGELWRDQLAAVPFERRLLLLPKCMRLEDRCPAPFDELGLLCKQCGLCSIQDLQEEAERLGYAVLVAEGSALVMAIIETGRIEAIVGVSCLSVLEKAFPFMEAAAIPGVAIPLLQDDCRDVTVDMEWIWDVIHLTSQDRTYRLDLDGLRRDIQRWFTRDALDTVMGPVEGEADALARDWLAQDGKRWRPFLAVCVWKALQSEPDAIPDDDVRRIAIAVECFHKASLIHDDIEDADDERYGVPTLHALHGIPIALNVGDLLLGEGYRLIGECQAAPDRVAAMLRVAAAGHRTLCLGQGTELRWSREPGPLSSNAVLEIFRQKTAPAFDVALQLGALLSGEFSLTSILARFSTALGIAYQIRDDLDDLAEDGDANRPTLPLALLYERTARAPEERALVEKTIRGAASPAERAQVRELLGTYEVPQKCRSLQEAYKEEALRALAELQTPSLKGLLRRVISKMFSIEVKGWCNEFETRNAAGGEAGAVAAGGSSASDR